MKRFLLALLFAACAAPISQEGKTVRVVSVDAISGCKFIEQVSVYSGWGGLAAQELGKHSATNQLRNEASKVGGTHVVIVRGSTGMGGSTILGDAYKCSE